MSAPTFAPSTRIAFIGGGNMASAVIGGLIQRGLPAAQIAVVEPFEAARTALREHHGIDALPPPAPRWPAPTCWSGPSSRKAFRPLPRPWRRMRAARCNCR